MTGTQHNLIYASCWRRLVAFIVDALPFWLAANVAIAFIFQPIAYIQENGVDESSQMLINEATTAIYALYSLFLLWAIYIVASHLIWGQSLGKKLLKIKVIRTKSRKNHILNILIRELPLIGIFTFQSSSTLLVFDRVLQTHNLTTSAPLWALSPAFTVLTSLFLIFWIIVSIITVLATGKRNRTLHDIMAGTVVVKITAPDTFEAQTQA